MLVLVRLSGFVFFLNAFVVQGSNEKKFCVRRSAARVRFEPEDDLQVLWSCMVFMFLRFFFFETNNLDHTLRTLCNGPEKNTALVRGFKH